MVVNFGELSLAAETLDDLERSRISNENRLRQFTRSEEDKDGEVRGFCLSPNSKQLSLLVSIVDEFKKMEHKATLGLQREFRKTPFNDWQKTKVGIGEKQLSRLLAKVQDPYWNTLHDRPRTVSELWAYCGLHVIGGKAARRKKGVQANWSSDAKMRAYLIAESCIKQKHSPYRHTYDMRRKHTEQTHPEWSAGQSHNDGLRIVSKEILKDLWIASRDIHEKNC